MRNAAKSKADAADAAPPSAQDWPLFDRPGFLARRVHQIHVSLFSELCAQYAVTPVQYSLLSALADVGAADQTTLARSVALDRTTTTGALKRLESRGLVRRSPAPADRRSLNCSLTDEGRRMLAEMEAPAREAHAATVAMLSPRERRQLIEAMKKIVATHAGRQDSLDLL
ncbi:MarR family transcriptional regulator [Azorhizobium oxalatiphilum]|uniref:MarR family transcriptional regulator n=1 Tax=Azorhizobium oxalatiphilum TaxID=980631 RepID=A0A917BL51_9HYPH|nr:MarR family transcriptional regulator [Azorhizobium oxalatiphilum]GGF50357.1 MarR family transcriptional regulator [Azorhizobium oxalatiphilum]